ncbi:hypothetical protein K9M79_07035 [Candidatus Woesearchaeota archaeon]|nr:hypothetical protein [Candidatus Woesearchaeota archaeon]
MVKGISITVFSVLLCIQILILIIPSAAADCCLDPENYCTEKTDCINLVSQDCIVIKQCVEYGCCIDDCSPMQMRMTCPGEFDPGDPSCEKQSCTEKKGCCAYYKNNKAIECVPKYEDFINYERGISEEECNAKEGYTRIFYPGIDGPNCQLICNQQGSVIKGNVILNIMDHKNYDEYWLQVSNKRSLVSNVVKFNDMPIGTYLLMLGRDTEFIPLMSISVRQDIDLKYNVTLSEIDLVNSTEESIVEFIPVSGKSSDEGFTEEGIDEPILPENNQKLSYFAIIILIAALSILKRKAIIDWFYSVVLWFRYRNR